MMPRVTGESDQSATTFHPVVIVPTFNHASTLLAVIEETRTIGLPMIVVDDGSTDDTASVMQAAVSRGLLKADHLLIHPVNAGKAAALRTGFLHATQAGYTHAVTIDSDGQHSPGEIPALLAQAKAHPHALILGERRDDLPGYPRASLIGRRLTNLSIRVACGLKVHDSQCGLRVYPLDLIEKVPCQARRYAFESEILTRATWAGWRVIGVPITSHYAPKAQRISHFRNIRDSLAGIALQCRLLLRSLWRRHERTAPAESSKS